MIAIGASGAFIQQYRFAAADAAEPAFKPRAISWVMAAGVVTGIIGPQIAINAGLILPIGSAAASFIVLAVLMLIAAAVMTRLVVPAPKPVVAGGGGRPLREIVLQPKFLVALLSAVASFSLMSFVMTATPLAMVGHHHTDRRLPDRDHRGTSSRCSCRASSPASLIARFGAGTVVDRGLRC